MEGFKLKNVLTESAAWGAKVVVPLGTGSSLISFPMDIPRIHAQFMPPRMRGRKQQEQRSDLISVQPTSAQRSAPISSHKCLSPAEHLFVNTSKHWASNRMSSSALPPFDPVPIYELNHSDSCYPSQLNPFEKIL